jgi:hypothetical protein
MIFRLVIVSGLAIIPFKMDGPEFDFPPDSDPPIYEIVMENLGWFGYGMCQDEIMLLFIDPKIGFSDLEISNIWESLGAKGCEILERTDENFEKFQNPNEYEWRFNRLKGAFSSHIAIKQGSPFSVTLSIGIYKGHLSARGRYFELIWNGEKWEEDKTKFNIFVS